MTPQHIVIQAVTASLLAFTAAGAGTSSEYAEFFIFAAIPIRDAALAVAVRIRD